MDVSIILVSFNTKDLTIDCLSSIYERVCDIDFEIIVVDNASSDGTCEQIKLDYPNVKLIENNENLGFAKANNIAIKESSGKYLFLLNTDTILLNNAPKIFVNFMDDPENVNVACCGGRLFQENMKDQHSYGIFPSLKQLFFNAFSLHKIFKSYYLNHLCLDNITENNYLREVNYITGANMFIRRDILNKVGLFDERFFLYFEETELCYRFNKSGFKSYMVPEARIIHFCGQSQSGMSLEKEKIWRNSELKFFEKCYGKMSKFIARVLYLIIFLKNFIFKLDVQYLRKMKILLES